MNRDFIGALLQLNAEKNIPREQLVATLADAIQSAYRRTSPGNENVYVDVDQDSGKFNAYRAMVVVDEVEDPMMEFTVDDAKNHNPGAKVGDLVRIGELDANSFGRIHAQMATQLVRQRLREVEREQVFGQYAQRESEIITGTVSRVEPRGVILDVGRAEAILPTTDQSATEHYRIGQHVKAYVLEVRRTTRGPLIYVSRTHKNFLRRLFELEVPEIHAGTVEIKAIAREAGSRSKVGVASRQDGLDPVGATVGQRGGRVQAVVAELGGEKIDIIPWNEDPAVFVANALSPAQVVSVTIDEENRIANVTVPERMLSLAIGREGQNARLAAKLTGWRIDIRSDQAQARPPTPAPESVPAQIDEASAVAPAEKAASAVEPAAKPKRTRAKPALADTEPATAQPEAVATDGAKLKRAPKTTVKAAPERQEKAAPPAKKAAAKTVVKKAATTVAKKAAAPAAKKAAAPAAKKAKEVKPAAAPRARKTSAVAATAKGKS
ncbi:MAG: transcription termination factor NusA [Chloroflexota bacterium]